MTLSAFCVACRQTAVRLLSKDTFQMGAALAYYAIFSLSPLVLIAVSIAAAVFGEKAARGQLASDIESAVGPTAASAVQEMVRAARTSGSSATASIVGFVILIFGASGLFAQMQSSLNAIWGVPTRRTGGLWGWIRSRALAFGMVLGSGFLLLVSLVASTTISAMSRYVLPGQTVLYQLLNQLIFFGFVTLAFAALFKFLPDCKVAWTDVWVGAALTAVLFGVGKYLIGLYLAKGSVASAYGAAGSMVVILVWVYYASQIVLFGAQFTQVIAERAQRAPGPTNGVALCGN